MNLFNIYGLIFIVIIMIPNIVFALKCKDGFVNKYNNKFVEFSEQIGRFGSFIFMIFNIPKTYFGFYFNNGLIDKRVYDAILSYEIYPFKYGDKRNDEYDYTSNKHNKGLIEWKSQEKE